jgi:hypothetical protein
LKPFWKAGRASKYEMPPPDPFQAVWPSVWPTASRRSLVPPMDSTSGAVAP